MRRLPKHGSGIKLFLWLAMIIALSVLAKSNPVFVQNEKSSITSSTIIPGSRNIQQVKPQVYWLRSNQNKITLVARSFPSNTSNSSSPQQGLTTAMQQLLVAQPRDDLSSTIPQGTKLLGLQVRSDGVHIDLSPEFRSGGGSTSMIYRVAQVIYTSTSLDPNTKVFISIGGQSIDNKHPLGGEGLILRQPTTRSQFAADFL
jgi:spore germination protein GerM